MTFISETWLICSVTNSMLDPRRHFNILKCDRPDRFRRWCMCNDTFAIQMS